jgi:hypothetical protein
MTVSAKSNVCDGHWSLRTESCRTAEHNMGSRNAANNQIYRCQLMKIYQHRMHALTKCVIGVHVGEQRTAAPAISGR